MVEPNLQSENHPAQQDAAGSRATPPEQRSLPQLISDLANDLAILVRGEVQLVRAEIGEKAGRVMRAAAEAGLGVVLLVAALIFLLQAASVALSGWLGPVWANVALSIAIAVLGLIGLQVARKTAAPDNLTLDRSARQLQETVRAAKGETP